jgi:hypothetical protein
MTTSHAWLHQCELNPPHRKPDDMVCAAQLLHRQLKSLAGNSRQSESASESKTSVWGKRMHRQIASTAAVFLLFLHCPTFPAVQKLARDI